MKELAFLVTYQDHCHFNWSSNVRKEIKLWILYLSEYIYCMCIWFPTKFIRLIRLSIDFQGLNVLKKYWIHCYTTLWSIFNSHFIQTMQRERERRERALIQLHDRFSLCVMDSVSWYIFDPPLPPWNMKLHSEIRL